MTHAYLKRIRRSVRREIFDYLRTLPLNLDIEAGGRRYLLVHGGVLDRYGAHTDRYDNPVHYAVWYRLDSAEPELEEKTILFGHTHTSRYQPNNPLEIWRSPGGGKIGIDCGWRTTGSFTRRKRFRGRALKYNEITQRANAQSSVRSPAF